jgi:hypothetical protein
VPLAFAYPGATDQDPDKDTVLALVRGFLATAAPGEEPALAPIEEAAMERVLAIQP